MNSFHGNLLQPPGKSQLPVLSSSKDPSEYGRFQHEREIILGHNWLGIIHNNGSNLSNLLWCLKYLQNSISNNLIANISLIWWGKTPAQRLQIIRCLPRQSPWLLPLGAYITKAHSKNFTSRQQKIKQHHVTPTHSASICLNLSQGNSTFIISKIIRHQSSIN